MTAVLLALGASFGWGCSDFIAGVKTRALPLLSVLLVSQAAGLLLVLGAAFAWGGALPGMESVAWAVAAGGAELVGFAALYRGLAVGAMCVVAPISATAAVVPLLVGVVAGERVGALQSAGIALALAGVALASLERIEDGRRSWQMATGLGLAALAALGFGGFFVAMDRASDGGVLWAVALNRWTSLALLVLCAASLRRRVAVARADRVAVIGVGTLDIAANVLFAAALTYGVAGPVSVLGSLYPLTTVFLAFVVLRERVSGPQGLGAASALAGVGLVAAAT